MAEINLAALLGGVGLFLLGMTMMSGGLKLSLGPALTRRLRDWTNGRLRGLLFGSVGAMLYSLAGAVLSLAVMALLRRIDRFSTVGISVAGGVASSWYAACFGCLALNGTALASGAEAVE